MPAFFILSVGGTFFRIYSQYLSYQRLHSQSQKDQKRLRVIRQLPNGWKPLIHSIKNVSSYKIQPFIFKLEVDMPHGRQVAPMLTLKMHRYV